MWPDNKMFRCLGLFLLMPELLQTEDQLWENEDSITVTADRKNVLGASSTKARYNPHNMAHREMIDGVMKELMRGIKITAAPINQHNCACNDTGAISNTGQCTGSRGGRGEGRRGRGDRRGPDTVMASQCQVHIDYVLWLLKEHSFICFFFFFSCATMK